MIYHKRYTMSCVPFVFLERAVVIKMMGNVVNRSISLMFYGIFF
jgi:hypothetical protein